MAIPAEGLAPGESAVRVFGVFSAEQDALIEWLRGHQINTVAMEATGIYWLSLYDKLEAAGIEFYLVDPPVSYTHLDVYKRQDRNRAMARSIGSRPNGSCGSVESRRREFGVRGSNCRGPAQKRTGTNGSPTESVATARHTWRWISM